MEGIAPTLQLCLDLRLALENGRSTAEFLRYLPGHYDSTLRNEITQILMQHECGEKNKAMRMKSKSVYRHSLFVLLWAGLSGEPIMARLKEIESEIYLACEEEIELYISRLPLKVLMPMLFLQLPAYLLIMFGPLLTEFTQGVLK